MSDAIGSILPLALAMAISPPPIIAIVLLLLSPAAKRSSLTFLVGWVAGILVAIVAFTALASVIPERDPEASRPFVGVLQLVLGAAVLALAARYVITRPRAGEAPKPPQWMSAIDGMTPTRALGFGFALAALNPKNLLLAMNAGLELGTHYLDLAPLAAVIAIFTVLATSSVLIPVIAYLIASDRLEKPLRALEEWLITNSWLIMALLLLVIGTVVVGNGLENF